MNICNNCIHSLVCRHCDECTTGMMNCNQFYPKDIQRSLPKKTYHCTCVIGYPNKNYKRANGHWKCIDDFEFVEETKRGYIHCKRKEKPNEQ